MRLRHAEEMTGTTGAPTSIHRRGFDGTLGDGRGWALHHHLDGEPILPHGGVFFSRNGLSVSQSRTRRP